MSKKTEIYLDITQNCDIILDLLKPFEAENETAEGRMIYQCRWLKEQISANTLPLPTEDFVHTLQYVSAEGLIGHIASSVDTEWNEVGIYLYRLVALVDNKLLLKKEYYHAVNNMIDALINILQHAGRPLSEHEQGLVPELYQLKSLLAVDRIEPPLMSYFPDYPHFRKVFRLNKSSIDDLPDGKLMCKTVANLIFEGIRPDTWLAPEDAEREAQTPSALVPTLCVGMHTGNQNGQKLL